MTAMNASRRTRLVLVWTILTAWLVAGCAATEALAPAPNVEQTAYDVELVFPSNDYPETALHIYGAIEQGASAVCTIDRAGAADNRKASLAGIDTMNGYDRDEWPMAMCEEGGAGASVAYIDASDNRGAGSWVGNKLTDYPDGTRVLFVVEKPVLKFGKYTEEQQAPSQAKKPVPAGEGSIAVAPDADEVVYRNCEAARAVGKAPLREGEPGYSRKLDRDGDGIACE